MADLHHVDPIEALAELAGGHAFLEEVFQVLDLRGLGFDLDGEKYAGLLRLVSKLDQLKPGQLARPR
ncbi:hypothetical protein D3C80_2233160 [compost metagenome]